MKGIVSERAPPQGVGGRRGREGERRQVLMFFFWRWLRQAAELVQRVGGGWNWGFFCSSSALTAAQSRYGWMALC